MDLSTIGGFILGLLLLVVGMMMEKITIKALMGPSAAVIVFGCSLGIIALSHTVEELKLLPRALKTLLSPPKLDYAGTVEYLVGLATKARRNGLLSLQEDAASAPNPLVARGLTMAADGSDPETIEETLEMISAMEADTLKTAAAVFDTGATYGPGMGILGTVIGLVVVMGNLSTPDKLGPAIAIAFLSTIYGLIQANFVCMPISAKLKGLAKRQNRYNEMLTLALVGIVAGENPRNLGDKLSLYIVEKPKPAKASGEALNVKGAPAVE